MKKGIFNALILVVVFAFIALGLLLVTGAGYLIAFIILCITGNC